MPRFFIDYNRTIPHTLKGADARHIIRSLRMQPGRAADHLRFFGEGL